MIIGYSRTSTTEQIAGLEAQDRELKAAGAQRIFTEQVSSLRLENWFSKWCEREHSLSSNRIGVIRAPPFFQLLVWKHNLSLASSCPKTCFFASTINCGIDSSSRIGPFLWRPIIVRSWRVRLDYYREKINIICGRFTYVFEIVFYEKLPADSIVDQRTVHLHFGGIFFFLFGAALLIMVLDLTEGPKNQIWLLVGAYGLGKGAALMIYQGTILVFDWQLAFLNILQSDNFTTDCCARADGGFVRKAASRLRRAS